MHVALPRWKQLGMVALLIGFSFRFFHYFDNRSLWVDEASLAMNVLHQTLGELRAGMENLQMAPYGFLALSRTAVTFFGSSELSLRFFPFIASLLALILFWRLLALSNNKNALLIAFSLFALSHSAIFYSAEFKQYAFDILGTVIVLGAALFTRGPLTTQTMIIYAIAGGILTWFSYPIAFVLAGFGSMMGIEALQRRDATYFVRTAICASIWLSAFVGHLWFTNALGGTVYTGMAGYWHENFAPFPPVSSADVLWYAKAISKIWINPLGLASSPLSAVLLSIAFTVGLYHIYRERPGLTIVIVLPLVIALVTSAMHLYPFYGRLLLFSAPLIFLSVGYGLAALMMRPRTGVAVGALMAFVFLNSPGVAQLASGFKSEAYLEREDAKGAIEFINAHPPENALVYAHGSTMPATRYYSERGLIAIERIHRLASLGERHTIPSNELQEIINRETAWILFTHTPRNKRLGVDEPTLYQLQFDQHGQRLLTFNGKSAIAILYEFPQPK